MRRRSADAGSNRSATATACCRCTSRTHTCRHRRRAWRRLWWLGRRELLAYGRCGCGWSYFVITSATTQVDEIRIVRILQDSQEIPFAQTLAIAAKELPCNGAHVAGSRRSSLRNGAANEIERV